MNYSQEFIESLKSELDSQLPGPAVQAEMMPDFRGVVPEIDSLKPASVCICFIIRNDKLYFPLIRRTEHASDIHSKQISLPGGQVNPGENIMDAARREVFEEIGILTEKIDILGKLSILPIPISGFLVHPFVGICTDPSPSYTIDPLEVDEVFDVPINDLLNGELRKEHKRKDKRVPYFHFNGEVVWGATAMILSEMAEVLKTVNAYNKK